MNEDTHTTNTWSHPGGKLRELGPRALSTKEILAILISTGHKGKSAEDIAGEILEKFESLEKLSNMPLAELLDIKRARRCEDHPHCGCTGAGQTDDRRNT